MIRETAAGATRRGGKRDKTTEATRRGGRRDKATTTRTRRNNEGGRTAARARQGDQSDGGTTAHAKERQITQEQKQVGFGRYMGKTVGDENKQDRQCCEWIARQ